MTAVMEPETHDDVRAELRAAQAEHDAAHGEWRLLTQAIEAVQQHGVLISLDAAPKPGRTLRSAGRPTGRRLDPVEAAATAEDLGARRAEVAKRLLAARDRLNAARVAAANQELPALAEQHRQAAEAVEREASAATGAYAVLVARLLRLQERRQAEVAAARALLAAASSAAPTGDARDTLTALAQSGQLATELSGDGFPATTQERPDSGLFGLAGESWEPSNDRFGGELVEIVRGGRRRLPSSAEQVETKILEQLELLENE